jgi:ATP-dependent DNA helicase RecQ
MEIAERRGLREQTIEEHLAECILEGRAVEISRHVSATDFDLIKNAIALHGSARLKPLRDALPDHITYGMIRFAVAHLHRAEERGD